MDELQNQIENSNSRLYCLALFFSTLYIIRSATLWEPFADFAEIFRYFAWLFCSLILLFSISKYNSNQHVLIICVVLLSLFVGENCNRLDFMYFSSALIIGAKDIKFESIIKFCFVLGLSFCVFNIIGNQMGVIKDANFIDLSDRLEILDDVFLRESFGYDWCTDFASHVFLIILSYWIIRKGILKYYEMFLLLGISIFILYMTGTRMAAGCIVAVILFSLYCKFRNPQKISKLVWLLFVFSVPIFAILSLYLTVKYDETEMNWMAVDLFMSGRLHIGQEAIMEKGIPWFGQEFVMYGMGNSNGGAEYNYIDNSYIQYLVICGIMATIAFSLCYVAISYKAYKQKKIYLSLAVFLSGLFGVITQFHYNFAFCPLLLATCSSIDSNIESDC